MHRQKLITLLDDYAIRYPEESAVVERFVTFARSHREIFERSFPAGHVTGSAWLVNAAGSHVLLTHHKKLDRWLQLGGHSDGEADPLAVAVKEAQEESGLAVEPVWRHAFDLDVHEIPARGAFPAHFHYDVRFALRTAGGEDFLVSDESHDLAWVAIPKLRAFTEEESVLRMGRKWLQGEW